LLSGLAHLGWRVPQDLSVCGFGDLPMTQVVVPALTTVHIGLRDLGRAGARKLLALLRHEQVPQIEVQPTSVIERGTTAQAPDLP